MCFGIGFDFATNNNLLEKLRAGHLRKTAEWQCEKKKLLLYKVFKFIWMHKIKTGTCMHVILIVISVKIITASDRGILELWETIRLLCLLHIFVSLMIITLYFHLRIVFWIHINQDITFFQIFPEPGRKRRERYSHVI